MRERLALLREYLKNRLAFGKNKKTRKGFILTMVALVEVLAISVVSVSAWVETISTITIKAEGAKIDNYVYTNADIGSGDGYSNKIIDLTKYFRAAGGVHLASASSADGENIFFPIKKSGESKFGVGSYRCADVNDKNVNYIDFSFNVKVDKTFKADHAEFYLDQVPKITIGGGNVSGNLVRMAITDTDTQNTVVCGSNAGDGNVVNKADGTKVPEKVQAFSDFVVSSESIPTELFRVDRGSSKTINIKVWLQDDNAATAYAGKTVSITDVNIVTQNKKGNKVYFVDRTVNDTTKNWTKNVTFQQGSGTSVAMKFDAKSHTYYCDYTPAADDTKVKFTSGSVTWATDMKSLNSGDSMYYTAYGDHNSSNAGYGTWGEVIEISVSSKTADVLPDTGNVSSVYMVPDNDTNSKVRMPFTNDKNKWVGYIAKEKADKMTFSFTNNGNTYKIPAPNRGNSTLFVVTSATTGYWDPPATITVTAGKNDAGDPKVSYDGLTSTTISVTPGTRVKLEANPKTGFVLKNWVNSGTSTVADGIDSNGYFTPTASGNYNFTAVYSESMKFEAYVRTYDGKALSDSTNGGKVKIVCGNQTPTDEEYTDETHITLNAVKGSTVTYYAKANDGYVFDGWYTDADCKSNSENSSYKYELANVQDSKRLYAKFKVDTYTVEAYAQHGNDVTSGDAGKVSFDNINYKSKVTTTVNRNGEVTFYAKPESGYAFIGWYKNTTDTDTEPKVGVGSCTKIKDSNGNYYYTYKETIKTKNVKLYARFKALYTVDARAMYNAQNVVTGGTVQVGKGAPGNYSKDTVMEGDKVTVTASANNGYKFAGWYTDEICSKPYFKENNNVSPITLNKVSKGITLYAKFELETGVTFYLNDGGLWSGDKAKLAAYVWDDNGNKKWLEVSKTDYDNYYSFALDNNQWKQVIFVRYDPSKNLNDFPTKDWNGYVWNKTSDITIDYNNNCYVITSSPNNGGSSTGYWTSYTPGQTANIDIYVYTGNCSWFDHDSAVLAYRFSTDDSFKSDCTKVTKDGKTYWKLSIPTDKDTIYLSRAALGGHHNEFNNSIDKSKNLFTVNNDFNGGDWSTY